MALDTVKLYPQHFGMSHYTEHDLESIGDSRHLVMAAAHIARLDEAISRLDDPETFHHAHARRTEALAITAVEGGIVRAESLCRLLGNPETSNLPRHVRQAADVHAALLIASNWTDAVPEAEELRRLFETSDASLGRRMTQDVIWTLEEDSQWLLNELASFAERPNPWNAIESIRSIWTSGRFFGTSRRVALLVSGWIMRLGFECKHPVLGLAAGVARTPDVFRDASQDRIAWLGVVSDSMREWGRRGLAAIANAQATRLSMLALCPPEKNSSSIEPAISFMMRVPVFTAKVFADGLDLTPRGAKVVLDKLRAADLVEADDMLRNRTFVCRRAI